MHRPSYSIFVASFSTDYWITLRSDDSVFRSCISFEWLISNQIAQQPEILIRKMRYHIGPSLRSSCSPDCDIAELHS
jgi:hypothetical protein